MTFILNHHFKDKKLLVQALTHTSAAKKSSDSNERLEFLGDRVLNMLVAELLFELFPKENEGDLARRLTNLVCAPALQDIALEIDLPEAIRLSGGEASSGGAAKMNVLADACEALVAALYLDGGLDTARQFVRQYWTQRARADLKPVQDSKSALQEWAQGRGLPLPIYTIVERSGPDHAPVFVVSVSVDGLETVSGQGANKREAEKAAAEILLNILKV